MPVLRYFVVMGCCLVGLLFAADLIWPGDRLATAHNPAAITATEATAGEPRSVDVVQPSTEAKAILSSVDKRFRPEERFEPAKPHSHPVIYPNVATLAPTADRLQWERQLRYLPANHVYEARAEMPKEATTEEATTERPKVGATSAMRRQTAHARPIRIAPEVERPRYARNAAWDPFGLFD